ncbi:hypothetical protein NP493_61g00012 [Ridgeia piscesae]|uniref:Calcineurin-like phosphoesterase domain-containing protein n=1 Tax=Ridgeia piscesae TaxID=27915 RepID=A0AAD9PAG8_RIDPI|nr:hypothetical protein NP493_61g00012 [Ridgeia piscesae]
MDTLPLHTPLYSDRVRFVCISDTHAQAEKIRTDLPPGDVLIHAGDFTNTGTPNEVMQFNAFLGKLPYRHKIVIAGNHELSFDPHYMTLEEKRLELDCPIRINPIAVKDFLEKKGVSSMKELLTNCVYLEDSEVTICGLRIYGSPW